MDIEISSKAEMLRRIQAATGRASTAAAASVGWNSVARSYNRAGMRSLQARLELFADRLRDYDATAVWSDRLHLTQTIASILLRRSKRRIVIPSGLPSEWLPAEFEFVVDEGLSPIDLDKFDGVLTGAALAIAETGTVVLQDVPGQGRRAISLVPDYHLCLVRAEDVVEIVPEAMKRLYNTAGVATTFISGPSATADIEMTRIKGVHGPRVLDVILIG